MLTGPRALIAFVAGSIVVGRTPTSIYDFSQSGFRLISGTVAADEVTIYDFTDGCHLTGKGSNSGLSLYHFGQGAHITLDMKGHKFSGYDFGSSCHFNGSVSDKTISIYDFGEGAYFNYTI
jgi:hypothetical protein